MRLRRLLRRSMPSWVEGIALLVTTEPVTVHTSLRARVSHPRGTPPVRATPVVDLPLACPNSTHLRNIISLTRTSRIVIMRSPEKSGPPHHKSRASRSHLRHRKRSYYVAPPHSLGSTLNSWCPRSMVLTNTSSYTSNLVRWLAPHLNDPNFYTRPPDGCVKPWSDTGPPTGGPVHDQSQWRFIDAISR